MHQQFHQTSKPISEVSNDIASASMGWAGAEQKLSRVRLSETLASWLLATKNLSDLGVSVAHAVLSLEKVKILARTLLGVQTLWSGQTAACLFFSVWVTVRTSYSDYLYLSPGCPCLFLISTSVCAFFRLSNCRSASIIHRSIHGSVCHKTTWVLQGVLHSKAVQTVPERTIPRLWFKINPAKPQMPL